MTAGPVPADDRLAGGETTDGLLATGEIVRLASTVPPLVATIVQDDASTKTSEKRAMRSTDARLSGTVSPGVTAIAIRSPGNAPWTATTSS